VKTLVYGAGPLGSYIAAKLHEDGVEVALLARGQRLGDLREHGVVLEHWRSGARETHHVPIVEELGEDDPYDLILVVMRKDQSQDILPVLAKNQHANTVLFLQNNAAGFADYTAALGAGRVMAGFPSFGGQRRDPVMRVMALPRVSIPIGEADGRVTDRTREVAALLERTGKAVEIRTDIDAWLVTHIPVIMGYGGLFAADLDAGRFARTRDAMLLGVRARTEALAAQPKAAIPIRPPSFRWLPLLPEPLVVALLWVLARTTFFEVGVVSHSKVAREELVLLVEEYRERIAPAGVATPVFDELAAHVKGTVASLPDGSREEPMRWGGLVGAAAGCFAAAAVARILRRRA
jgi:ketopantoate reductase